MKKRVLMIIGITMVALIVVSVSVFATQKQNMNYYLGRLFQEMQSVVVSKEDVLAEYKGEQLVLSVVEYYQEIWSQQLPDNQRLSERETIDQIMKSVILRKEAQDRGITATKKEIEEKVAVHKQLYKEKEIIRESIDAFCDGAGISVDDYFALLYDQSYNSIIKAKLSMQIQEEYCRRQGVKLETSDVPQEVQEAVQKEINQIVEQGMLDVIYY